MTCSDCVLAKNSKGENAVGSLGSYYARKALLRVKEKPSLNERYVCCHLCENDTMAPNGFTCCNPDHLVWGTYADNSAHRDRKKIIDIAKLPQSAAISRSFCPYCGYESTKLGLGKHIKSCPLKLRSE